MSLRDKLNERIHSTKRFLVAGLAGLLLTGSAVAQNLGTIGTDLWYTVGEEGWGVTIDHQQNVLFLTFYIYRSDGSPYWVTAVLNKVGTSGLATTPQVFTGNVFEDHGPYFGGAFNTANVAETTVGTATLTSSSFTTATLQYSVNGVNVSKNLQRLTLSYINYSAQYLGGTSYTLSSCANPTQNGTTIVDSGTLTVNQTGTAFQLIAHGQSVNCTFTGTYSQAGTLGQVDGTYSCSDTTTGPFTFYAMQWTLFGMSGGVRGSNQFCSFNGYLGGITNQHVVP